MAELPIEIEIQRVMNLVKGFGWEKTKEEIQGKIISITIEKKIMGDNLSEGVVVPS
ncbi:hypothetical protein LCGC14_0817680 [marine sediment metagenome]|uniref:Uncharacterized protein n=1 Tax=marine sediment metagenome TaxID=412755 RepID=A0A0F9PPD9_9ZZZZ